LATQIDSVRFEMEECLNVYRSIINVTSLTSELVKKYLEAQNYLEEINLIKPIGYD